MTLILCLDENELLSEHLIFYSKKTLNVYLHITLLFCFYVNSWMPQRVHWLSWHKHVRKLENQTHFLPPPHRVTLKTLDIWRPAASTLIPNQKRRKIQNLHVMVSVSLGHRAPLADLFLSVLLKFRTKTSRKTEMAIKVHLKPPRWPEVDVQRLSAKQDTNLKRSPHRPGRQWRFPLLPVSDWAFRHLLHFLFHCFQEALRVSLSQFCLY